MEVHNQAEVPQLPEVAVDATLAHAEVEVVVHLTAKERVLKKLPVLLRKLLPKQLKKLMIKLKREIHKEKPKMLSRRLKRKLKKLRPRKKLKMMPRKSSMLLKKLRPNLKKLPKLKMLRMPLKKLLVVPPRRLRKSPRKLMRNLLLMT